MKHDTPAFDRARRSESATFSAMRRGLLAADTAARHAASQAAASTRSSSSARSCAGGAAAVRGAEPGAVLGRRARCGGAGRVQRGAAWRGVAWRGAARRGAVRCGAVRRLLGERRRRRAVRLLLGGHSLALAIAKVLARSCLDLAVAPGGRSAPPCALPAPDLQTKLEQQQRHPRLVKVRAKARARAKGWQSWSSSSAPPLAGPEPRPGAAVWGGVGVSRAKCRVRGCGARGCVTGGCCVRACECTWGAL